MATLRRVYGAIILAAVAFGLAIHFHGIGLPGTARDVAGDALWASMIFWCVSLVRPRDRAWKRAVAAVAICFLVEFSQQIEHPFLRAIRELAVGHLVIGSDFDARDLGAYVVGIAAGVLLDSTVVRAIWNHSGPGP